MAKHFVYTLVFLFLLTFNCELFSQESQSDWKQIDSLMNLGLHESALPNIEAKLFQAKQDQDVESLLKSVLLKMEIMQQKGVEINQIIEMLTAEVNESFFPATSILYSLLAGTYQNYYNRNQWDLDKRTNLRSENTNIEFWTAIQFRDKIKNNYFSSLQKPDSLFRFPIEDFREIIKGDFLSKKNNASLYEVLAKKAIHYFSDLDKISIPQLKGKLFTLFKPHPDFIKIEIDSGSGPMIALNIYQDLLRGHLNSGNIRALIQTDLDRLKLVNKLFLARENELKFVQSLNNLINLYPNHPGISEVYYEIARLHSNRGLKFDPFTNIELKWEYKKAVEICQFVIKKFPNSDGASLCELMLEKIETPFIGIDLKSVQLPNTPILASLSFQNCSNVYFKLIKLNYKEARKVINFSRDLSYLEPYLKKIPYNVWQENLPLIEDYQRHHAQIRIPDLDLGFYVLLTSNSPSFDKGSQVHLNSFTVSELSLISRDDGIKGKDYFILNRKSGAPFKGAKLSLFKEQYDQSAASYSSVLIQSKIADEFGFIHFEKSKSSIYQQRLSYRKDTLFESYTHFRSFNQKQKTIHTQFYTDRKIYRPGQIVYYKGIISKSESNVDFALEGKTTKIKYLDSNFKLIESVNKISDDFGSFNGSFVIPVNIRKGIIHINNESGSHDIMVEEYKLPKFEIKFDTLKEQYRINDTVKISGSVKSFAGIPLGNTRLKYRINRLNYDFFESDFSHRGSQSQISLGEEYTKADGSFEFDFHALADFEQSNTKNQIYRFQIEVELTDINGETQFGEITIPISDANLFLETIKVNAIDKHSAKGFPIVAKNINGQVQAVNVLISVFKLISPERAFKERIWEKPDVFLSDQESFYTYFPNDQFANEAALFNWKILEQVFQAEINTDEQSEIEIFDFPSWEDGKYKLVLKAKDEYDEVVEKLVYFTLFDSRSSSLPYPIFDWFHSDKDEYEVGDTCTFYIGSAAKELSILYEIRFENKVVLSDWISLDSSQKQLKFPLSKSFEGVLNLEFLFIYDNVIYQRLKQIRVVDSKEKIQLHLNTFRSVLSPNNKEEWEIQIRSPKGIVQAELVAAMTDFSLEKIMPYKWSFYNQNKTYENINWKPGRFNLSFSRTFGKFAYRYFGEITNSFPSFYESNLKRDGVFKIKGASTIIQADVINEEMSFSPGSRSEYPTESTMPDIKLRKNFNETAFFFPNLRTDKNGIIKIKFIAPESLTKWKVKLLAHTKDLKTAYLEKEVITQKELMLTPNLPRFIRVGDSLFFSVKISNLSENEIKGHISLQLFDAISGHKLFAVLLQDNETQNFLIHTNSSVNRRWKLRIPKNVDAIKYRLVASSENHSDGEERIIPVLSNRILVTESMPLYVNPNETKEVLFNNLINSGTDSLLQHHQLKLEFTSNPMWYAILALPYIDDDQKENAMSLFNRFYANSLASNLLSSNPAIEEVFKQLKSNNSQAMESELSKNKDLKSILLQETPWLLDARNESDQKQKLALFFDRNTISVKLEQNLKKLLSLQLNDGSWAWYSGGRGSFYITQAILSGLVKLDHQSIINSSQNSRVERSIERAFIFLKRKFISDYKKLKKQHIDYLDKDYLNASKIQFLYILSHFQQLENEAEFDLAMSYYLDQTQRFWMSKSNYLQAMIAIVLHRKADEVSSKLIMQSLLERSTLDDEMGRYWNAANSYNWYQRPIETQSLIIEAYNEIGKDKEKLTELKKYLLKQKQTQLWETPKSSVEAVNALLSRNFNLSGSQVLLQVKLGNRAVDFSRSESGTGFVEKRWNVQNIKPNLGKIQLKNTNSTISWGAIHWQYFQDLNKIQNASTGLKIEKQLYLKKTNETGAYLIPIEDNNSIKLGDRIISRILISADRDFDFVHLKDLRAAALEPIQVLSSYQYQAGLSYYASTTDVATHYYIDHLNKGNYVIEIEMIASQLGTFSNGISTIQCLYAPEFNAHTEGQRVVVK